MRSPSFVIAGLLLTGASIVTAGSSSTGPVHAAGPDSTTTLVITGPGGSGSFGSTIVVLANGNYVVTDPTFDLGASTDVGAIYLYDGATNQVISQLTGSHTNDQVGTGDVVEVGNGNVVITSPLWANGATATAGAATWVNGTTGLSGQVSAANSLVGTNTDDRVGQDGVEVLTNGNFVVMSQSWRNGPADNAGAVTFGTGAAGVVGAVTPANSLVGTVGNDIVGRVRALSNGNYVVGSPSWGLNDLGAATWGNGTTGTVGAVTSTNSLIGGTANDRIASNGITPLATGNYVVVSPNFSNTAPVAASAGAATWGNGTGGTHGVVTVANSLVGTTAQDIVGSFGVTALTNGAYVVSSQLWGPADVGAATWGSGATGVKGAVSAANSIVGSTSGDSVSDNGVYALLSGNFVVNSPHWDNIGAPNAGAATWGNGSLGSAGAVSASNSMVGAFANDLLGNGPTVPLANSDYVVVSPNWGTNDVGAATWGSGIGGTVGLLGSINSIVGTHPNDHVGSSGVVGLTTGNYVVISPQWTTGLGAVTFGKNDGTSHAAVSAGNSLVGSTSGDFVGGTGVTPLSNGNYVVGSPNWKNPVTGATSAGAATWGSGSTGVSGPVTVANSLVGTSPSDDVGVDTVALPGGRYMTRAAGWTNPATGAAGVGAMTWLDGSAPSSGPVTAANSFVGTTANDQVGNGTYTVLPDGHFAVASPFWDNGSIVNAGAVTLAGVNGITGMISATNSARAIVATPNIYPVDGFTKDHSVLVDTGMNNLIVLQLDVTSPVFGAAPPVTAVAPLGANATAVTFVDPAATDNRGAPAVACAPSSGSVFAIGATQVSCTATDGSGLTASTAFTVTVVAPPAGSDFLPLAPARLADTRPTGATADGSFAGSGPLVGGSEIAVVVAGRGGVPANAVAVSVNVTVTEARAAGYVTVYPCGAGRPTASNLNYSAGGTIPNAVLSQVGAGGAVCVFSSQTVHMVIDVNGVFPPTTSYVAINPARVLDTRIGQTTVDGVQQGTGPVAAGSVTPLKIVGRAGVPAGASAVVLNVTVTEPALDGYATVYPCGTEPPTASNLNYTVGLTIPNLVVAKIGTDGSVCVFSQGATHLVADVLGFFPANTSYVALQPARVLDTRSAHQTVDGLGAGTGLRPGGTVTVLHVAGRGGVPVGAATAVLNVTVTEPTAAGYVTVYPCGIDAPLASNLNFTAGQTVPNAIFTKIGTNGDVCLFNSQPTQLIADVAGYFP